MATKEGDGEWTILPSTYTSNSPRITGLTPASYYQVRVRAYCNANDQGAWCDPISFSTECEAKDLATEDYSENFDSYTAASGFLPLCWKKINEGTSYTNYPYLIGNNAHSTSNCMYFYAYGTNADDQYAILPIMENMEGKQITLWAKGYNTTSTFKIGMMTDPTDANTFELIDEQTLTTSYEEFSFVLGRGNHVAILMEAPTGLALVSSTPTEVTLSWTAGGTETAWQIAYSTNPNFDPDEVTPVDVTSNPGTINNLTHSTTYYAYVRANCGNNDYSDWSYDYCSFVTACGANTISDEAWTENFDSYSVSVSSATAPSAYPNDVMPTCWQFINRSTTSSTYPQAFLSSISSYAVSGNCLFFKSSSTTPLYAVLPEFSNDIANLELLFTYKNEGTGAANGTLYVSYMTDPTDATTFNDDAAVACEQNTSKTPMTVMFANAPAGSYFAFKYQGGSSNNFYLGIDDVSVKVPVFVSANQIVNSVSDPDTEMTWDEFVNHWNNGDHFTSSTITLMDDITASTMVGTAIKPFTGTFNGNSHTITVNLTATDNNGTAPFRVIKNATIQNLKVDGTINDGGHLYCAGFAGDCYGSNIFTNCVSDVTINATIEDDGAHGGFIARNLGGSATGDNLATTTFNGCAFTGNLLGAATTESAGFCGWSEYYSPNYARTIFNNCLFAPREVTMSTEDAATFALYRNASYVNFNNCYFMQDFNDGEHNTAQGKQAYTIAGVDPVNVLMSGEHTLYNMSGIDAYTVGMLHGYIKLAGEGDNVTLALSGAPGYEANHGTLTATGETYNLLMEAFNTEISAVDCPVPFNVAASDITATSAKIAWEGNGDTYTLQYREVITVPAEVNDTYNFDNNTLQGWTVLDNDGDGNSWLVSSSSSYSGSYCVQSTYTPNGSGYNANNWLISPQITLGDAISFYARQYSDNGNVSKFLCLLLVLTSVISQQFLK